MIRTVLCFGDSNTWGFVPGTGERYPYDIRWPGVLHNELGAGYRVIEEGLNGRTSVWDDPFLPGRNGAQYLTPCLDSHRPLDFIIVSLGVNDLKKRFSASAQDIARGVGVLLGIIGRSCSGPGGRLPATLVVAAPPLGPLTGYAEAFEGEAGRSARVAPFLKQIAEEAGCEFLDTAEHIAVSDVDGLHFDAGAHATLGRVAALRIREMAAHNGRTGSGCTGAL
jgi:lysophospholipase L1-like esterase